MLTQERLKRLLSYDPETGVFRHRKVAGRNCRMKDGEIAGGPKGHPEHQYYMIRLDGSLYYGHHLAWFYVYGEWPDEIDHKDRDGLNNAISNLRICSRSQNAINSQTAKPNINGFRGVHFHSDRIKAFSARIGVGRKVVYLGYFHTPEEAHSAYVDAAERYYGEFAALHREAIGKSDESARGTVIA